MQITVNLDIPTQRIADLMVTAFEGGSGYWCHASDVALEVPDRAPGTIYYADPAFWDGGGQIIVRYDDPDKDDEGESTGRKVFGLTQLAKGLQIMAEKYPRHFADFVAENDDADTGDCFLQCVILGDVVYG